MDAKRAQAKKEAKAKMGSLLGIDPKVKETKDDGEESCSIMEDASED